MADWYPKATKRVGHDAGPMTGGGRKIVLHTTEGSSASGAIATYESTGAWPHFTISPTELYQYLPLSRAARALEHPAGTCETNRDDAIQVEMVGFARDTQNWPDSYLNRIRELGDWIEANFKVPSKSTVAFTATPSRQARRLTCEQWHNYSGYLGHEHVPNNQHWDPGRFPIDKILGRSPRPAESAKLKRWRERERRAYSARDELTSLLKVMPAGDDREKVKRARQVVVDYAAELRALIREQST